MLFKSTLVLLAALACVAALVAVRPLARSRRRRELARALQSFKLQREMLEAKFVELASGLGKPRGLQWKTVDWRPGVVFARDIRTGLLTAFASIEIAFEAIPGGDMEDVEAVGLLRDAVAVFHYRNGRWGTGGKALFNMNSGDALIRLRDQFEAADPLQA